MSGGHRVRLVDGALFDPWDPGDAVPPFSTAAAGMSRICRYGGHVARHYTVLEHTLWVAVKVLAADAADASAMARALAARSARWPRMARAAAARPGAAAAGLAALAHDSPEGLGLVDMLRPVKNRPEMAGYREADERLLAAACRAWGAPAPDADRAAWAPAWEADSTVYRAENAIRPRGQGAGLLEEPGGGWEWLDLKREHVLDDAGETRGPGARQWTLDAACEAWAELLKAARP